MGSNWKRNYDFHTTEAVFSRWACLCKHVHRIKGFHYYKTLVLLRVNMM